MELFPSNTKINFMGTRYVTVGIFVLLMLASVVALSTKGFNYALDFTGGTLVEIQFEKPANVEEIRSRLDAAGYDSPIVQTFGSGNDIVIRLQPPEMEEGGSPQDADNTAQSGMAILAVAQTPDNPGQVIRSDFVGPQIGNELALNGIYATIFVALGFLAYIAIRFEFKFAIAAVLATMADVLVVCGWFAFTQHEFDLTVLAGILSVMGFSINDTIVVFDRIRENMSRLRDKSLTELINISTSQMLSRTIVTSGTTLLSVSAFFIWGTAVIQDLAFALFIGILVGTYSSIYIAAPTTEWMDRRFFSKKR